jgi:hypothetical protein
MLAAALASCAVRAVRDDLAPVVVFQAPGDVDITDAVAGRHLGCGELVCTKAKRQNGEQDDEEQIRTVQARRFDGRDRRRRMRLIHERSRFPGRFGFAAREIVEPFEQRVKTGYSLRAFSRDPKGSAGVTFLQTT